MLLPWMLALERSVCSMPLANIRSNGMLLLQMSACENECWIAPRDNNGQLKWYYCETKCVSINQNL